MSEPVTVKLTREQEVELEAQKARERALKKVRERDAVSEGFKAHTKGEKLFNDLTYTGFGYFGVTGLSVFMTWLIRDAKPIFGMAKPLSHYFDVATKAVSKWPMMSAGSARSILTIGTLFTGGSLMTVTGVKALEDNKAKLVRTFDDMIYGKETARNNPEIVEAHEIIDAQPKQTWESVGYSRLVAFAATISSWLLIGQNKVWLSEKLGTSIDTMGVQFGRFTSRILNRKNPEQLENIAKALGEDIKLHPNLRDLNEHDKGWTRILSYMGMDGLYTIITSVGLFISTRMFAPIFDRDGIDRLEKTTNKPAKNTPEEIRQTALVNLEREPTTPRVKVEHIDSIERLSNEATKHMGAI